MIFIAKVNFKKIDFCIHCVYNPVNNSNEEYVYKEMFAAKSFLMQLKLIEFR